MAKENKFRMTEKIALAKSFRQLYDTLKEMEKIKGSKLIYKANDLLIIIEDIRTVLEDKRITNSNKENIERFIKENNHLFEKVTRDQGLREKVIRLSVMEVVAMSKEIK